MSKQNTARRKHLRIAWRLPARLLTDQEFDGTTLEVSAGGASLLTDHYLRVGSSVRLQMTLPDIARPHTLEQDCRVVRAIENVDGQHYTALSFLDIAQSDRNVLRTAVIERALARVQSMANYQAFRDLTDLDLLQLASLWHEVKVPAGETVPQFGGQATSMFLVLRGSVEIRTPEATASHATHVQIARAGQVFGELATLLDRPHDIEVVALADAEMLVMPRSALTYLREYDPHLALLLYETFTDFIGRRVSKVTGKLLEPLSLPQI